MSRSDKVGAESQVGLGVGIRAEAGPPPGFRVRMLGRGAGLGWGPGEKGQKGGEARPDLIVHLFVLELQEEGKRGGKKR